MSETDPGPSGGVTVTVIEGSPPGRDRKLTPHGMGKTCPDCATERPDWIDKCPTCATARAAMEREANTKYEATMEKLTAAMRTAVMMLAIVSDEDLDWIEKTIQRADTMSFFLVAGSDFPDASRRLADQRELLRIVREVRKWGRLKQGPAGLSAEEMLLGGWTE